MLLCQRRWQRGGRRIWNFSVYYRRFELTKKKEADDRGRAMVCALSLVTLVRWSSDVALPGKKAEALP